MPIPNVVHFVFGLKPQEEEFLFVYYLAVYSCFLLNAPDCIYFHHHHVPRGPWWDALVRLPAVRLCRIPVPTRIGRKPIRKTAHRADAVRMRVLHEIGGVYLDIDTICVRPWRHLLADNDVVLGLEGEPDGICNAIMMARPRSPFFTAWRDQYEQHFEPDGWREASIVLPEQIAKRHPEWATVLPPAAFFLPSYTEVDRIFVTDHPVPPDLVALHLWETFALPHMRQVTGWAWADRHPRTLYGRVMRRLRQLHAARPALHVIHRRDTTNTGDMMSSCSNYYTFPDHRVVLHDIYAPQWAWIRKNDPIIFSGGGLLDCLDEWNRTINRCLRLSHTVIGWGVGFNLHHGTSIQVPLELHRFRLLGVRDAPDTGEVAARGATHHVPCSVCKHPLLQEVAGAAPVRRLGVCQHLHHPIPVQGDAKITNGAPPGTLVRFLAESRHVLTNSYHGVVLCHLLGTPVVLYGGFSQKFDRLVRPVARYSGDLEHDMKVAAQLAGAAPPTLDSSRRLNDDFYAEVMACLGSAAATPASAAPPGTLCTA